jgi:hypothetical protein
MLLFLDSSIFSDEVDGATFLPQICFTSSQSLEMMNVHHAAEWIINK